MHGQVEGAVVDRRQPAPAKIPVSLEGLLRVHVRRANVRCRRRFPAWSDRTVRSVGRSRRNHQVTAVSAEEQLQFGAFDHPGTPQRTVPIIAHGLRSAVPAWRSGANRQPRYLATSQLAHLAWRYAPGQQAVAYAERRQEQFDERDQGLDRGAVGGQ